MFGRFFSELFSIGLDSESFTFQGK